MISTFCRNQSIQVKDLLNLEFEPYLDLGGGGLVEMVCQVLIVTPTSAVSLAMISSCSAASGWLILAPWLWADPR